MHVVSFSYKEQKTHPRVMEAGLVVDARVLPNPHSIRWLRSKNGRDHAVRSWLFKFWETRRFLRELHAQILAESPETVAVGCVGGRHRSVFVAEWLAEQFRCPAEHLNL